MFFVISLALVDWTGYKNKLLSQAFSRKNFGVFREIKKMVSTNWDKCSLPLPSPSLVFSILKYCFNIARML